MSARIMTYNNKDVVSFDDAIYYAQTAANELGLSYEAWDSLMTAEINIWGAIAESARIDIYLHAVEVIGDC